MEVSKVVLSVFLFLAMAILATLLYFLLLYNPDSTWSADVDANGNIRNPVQYKGVLWRVADNVQSGFSIYAYDYSYFPSVHRNDYVDLALGITSPKLLDTSGNTNFDTVHDYTDVSKDGSIANYSYDSSKDDSGIDWYSQEWKSIKEEDSSNLS